MKKKLTKEEVAAKILSDLDSNYTRVVNTFLHDNIKTAIFSGATTEATITEVEFNNIQTSTSGAFLGFFVDYLDEAEKQSLIDSLYKNNQKVIETLKDTKTKDKQALLVYKTEGGLKGILLPLEHGDLSNVLGDEIDLDQDARSIILTCIKDSLKELSNQNIPSEKYINDIQNLISTKLQSSNIDSNVRDAVLKRIAEKCITRPDLTKVTQQDLEIIKKKVLASKNKFCDMLNTRDSITMSNLIIKESIDKALGANKKLTYERQLKIQSALIPVLSQLDPMYIEANRTELIIDLAGRLNEKGGINDKKLNLIATEFLTTYQSTAKGTMTMTTLKQLSESLINYIDNLNKGRDRAFLNKPFEKDGKLDSILTLLKKREEEIKSEITELNEKVENNPVNVVKKFASRERELEKIQDIIGNLNALKEANDSAKNMFGVTRALNEFKANMKQDLDKYKNPGQFIDNDSEKIKSGFLSTLISFVGNYFKKQDLVKLKASEDVIGQFEVKLKDSFATQERRRHVKLEVAPQKQPQPMMPPQKQRPAPPAAKFKPLYDAIGSGDEAQVSQAYDKVGQRLLTQDNLQKIYKTASEKVNNPAFSEEQRQQFEQGLGHLVTIANSNGITISQAEAGVPQEQVAVASVAQTPAPEEPAAPAAQSPSAEAPRRSPPPPVRRRPGGNSVAAPIPDVPPLEAAAQPASNVTPVTVSPAAPLANNPSATPGAPPAPPGPPSPAGPPAPPAANNAPPVKTTPATQANRGDLLAQIQAGKKLSPAPAPRASAQADQNGRGGLLAQIQAGKKLSPAQAPGAPAQANKLKPNDIFAEMKEGHKLRPRSKNTQQVPTPTSYPKGLSDLYKAISSGNKENISNVYKAVKPDLLTEDNLQNLYDLVTAEKTTLPAIQQAKFERGLREFIKIAKTESGIKIIAPTQTQSK